MPDNTIRGRFAPSPSGRLHLGNMLTFLLAWLDVRALGGTMVFRLEDLDPERSWEHYADLMADDLLWLGLDWDEGWHPGSQDSRQGTRTERYTAALDALTERGMVYDCYCSRAERLAASAPHPGEPREAGCPCRTLSELEVQKRLRMVAARRKSLRSRTRTLPSLTRTTVCRQPNCGTGATIFSSGARTACSPTSSP